MRVFWSVNILALLVTLVSCVPSGSDSRANCSSGQTFDARTRSCVSAGLTDANRPFGTTSSLSINEDSGYQSVSLSYGDNDGDLALSCSATSQNNGLIRRLEFQGVRLVSQNNIIDAQNIEIDVNSSFAASVSTSVVGLTRLITVNVISGVTNSLTVAGLINGDPVASTWVTASLSANQTVVANTLSYNLTGVECFCVGGSCSVTLAPADNFNGVTDLNYTVTDVDGTSQVKPATLTIVSVNDLPTLSLVAPIATTERLDSDTTTVVSGNLITNGHVTVSDPDDGDPTGALLVFDLIIAPVHGTLSLSSNGNFTYFTYAEETLDSFSFRVRDPDGGVSSTQTIDINIINVDDAPVGTLTTISSFLEDSPANGGSPIVLTYSDEEGDSGTSCSVTSLTGVYPTSACTCAAGVCSISLTGADNYNGNGSFNYRIFDAGGNTPLDQTVNFTIAAVADNPAILLTESSTDILQFTESTTHIPNSYSFTLDGAIDVDGQSITSYQLTSGTTNGTLTGCLNIGGSTGLSCTYVPSDGNISDSTTLLAAFPSTDLSRIATDSGTFYAKGFGDSYDGMQIELIDVSNMNSFFGVDAKAWYNNGNITIILDAGVANGADIVSAIAASPVVSKIIQFDSNGAIQNTMGTLTLAGGSATADEFSIQVTDSNGEVSTQDFHISIIPTLDSPTLCEYSSYAETTSCGINGCIGSIAPLSITPSSDGLIYYNTSSGACYESASGSWNVIDTHIKDRTVNELDTIVIDKVKIDEGGGSIEDVESITITNVDSSDSTLIPLGNIEFYFDSTNDGFTAGDIVAVGAPFAAGVSADDFGFQIRITPQTIITPSTILSSDIEITIQDSSGNTKEIEFTVTVQKISVDHGGWRKITAIGPKVNTLDIVEDPQNHCPYSLDMCNGGSECSGVSSPIGSITPDNADAVFLVDSGTTNTCFRMRRVQVQDLAFVGKTSSIPTITYVDTGAVSVSVLGSNITVNIDDGVTTTDQIKNAIEGNATASALVKVINLKATETQNSQGVTILGSLASSNWESFTTFCPITPAAFETGCATGSRSNYLSCIGNISPVGTITPTKLDSRYFDEESNMCYRSTGLTNADWEAYDKTAAITLVWDQFSLSGSGSISEYKVFRRLANEEFDFSQQINREAITGSSTSYTFEDDAEHSRFPPVPGSVYYYVVRPVINSVLGATSAENSTGTPGILRVMAPPKNMIFAHRWMINKRMCDQLGQTIDISQNHRCDYKGPGDMVDSGSYFYDFGKDLLIDRFEAGCPISSAPNCPGTADNSCVGIGEPGATGKNISVAGAGIVYYDRTTAMCYVSTGAGVSWTQFDTADITTYFSTLDQSGTMRNKRYNRSGLPPFTHVTQAQADIACTNLNDIPAIEILGIQNPISHELPSRKEQVAFSFWDNDEFTDLEMTTREVGLSLNVNSYCNSTNASGLNAGFNNLDKPNSSNYYSLPGSLSSTIRSLTTGSDETADCKSVFGVQDFVGNVSEWTRDRMLCSTMSTCAAPTTIAGAAQTDYSSSDVADTFGSWQIDGSRVSCIDVDVDGVCDNELPGWLFENMDNVMGRMSIPMGLPLRTDTPTTFATSDVDFSQIGADITGTELRDDEVNFNQLYTYGESTSCGAIVSGGHYASNGGAGQWTMEVLPCTATSYAAVIIGDITVKVDQDPTYVNRQIMIDSLGGGGAAVTENGLVVEVDVDLAGTTATDIVTAINAYFAGSANEMAAVVSGEGTNVQTTFSTPVSLINFTEEANPVRSEVGFRCKIDLDNADYDE